MSEQPSGTDRFDEENAPTSSEEPDAVDAGAEPDPDRTGADVEGGEELSVGDVAEAERDADPEVETGE